MVRLDKISYMITCFKPESLTLEQYDYSHPEQALVLSDSSIAMIKRIGATTTIIDSITVSQEFYKHIPYGREEFLVDNINRHSRNVCKVNNPNCDSCIINDHCDYYNKKNDWKIE